MSVSAPGLLRRNVTPDVVMMVCTAGHVDHGKTRLVKLLTGCNTDRLKAEQERGLTIELGFAPCLLKGDHCVGIVDVPGHEKFVRTMVAGVSGIELAILVVAADDGIMPQTIEHVQIMQLLGVKRGLIALTKIDLVQPERVEECAAQLREFLADTFLASAAIYPLSAETGEGVFEFYEGLTFEVEKAVERSRRGVFRMPVERAFAQRGFGSVVTGIPLAGVIHVGDAVELVPGGMRGRVRGIQRFLRDATDGGAGQCLALNVPEFDRRAIERGMVVAPPDFLRAESCMHVRLQTVPALAQALRHNESIKFHAGTAEVAGRIRLLESKELGGSACALATISLERPVAAAAGDRFILRRPSPAHTVGGGVILALGALEQGASKETLLAELRALESASAGDDAGDRRILYLLDTMRSKGIVASEIGRRLLMTHGDVCEVLDRLEAADRVLKLGDDIFIGRQPYESLLRDATANIERAQKQGESSLPIAQLLNDSDWSPALKLAIVADLEKAGSGRAMGGRWVLEDDDSSLSDAERQARDDILHLYECGGYQAPRPEELAGLIGIDNHTVVRSLQRLYDAGKLVRLNKNVVLARSHLRAAQEKVVAIIREHGVLDSGEFKNHIGSSRKYALAILDYLDARHVTLRSENLRKLAPNYEKHLI